MFKVKTSFLKGIGKKNQNGKTEPDGVLAYSERFGFFAAKG